METKCPTKNKINYGKRNAGYDCESKTWSPSKDHSD